MRISQHKRQGILTKKISMLVPVDLVTDIQELFPGRSFTEAATELLRKMVSIIKAGQAQATKLPSSSIIQEIGEKIVQ